MMATSAVASLPMLPPVRRGSHSIEENGVPTSKFTRRLLAVNNSRSFPRGLLAVNNSRSFPRGLVAVNNYSRSFPRGLVAVDSSRPFSCRRTRPQEATILCAAALNARCSAEQTQTITREAPTITHLPGKEKSPQLDDGGSGFPPRDDDDGGGGGGGGGNWSGGFFFFGFLAFLGFLKDKESEDDGYAYSDSRRRR